jgi:hypothetical protein
MKAAAVCMLLLALLAAAGAAHTPALQAMRDAALAKVCARVLRALQARARARHRPSRHMYMYMRAAERARAGCAWVHALACAPMSHSRRCGPHTRAARGRVVRVAATAPRPWRSATM